MNATELTKIGQNNPNSHSLPEDFKTMPEFVVKMTEPQASHLCC